MVKIFKNKIFIAATIILLCLAISGVVLADAIPQASNAVQLSVDYSAEPVQDEFTGAGTNSWIMLLSDESKEKYGMTEAHFDLNSKRIATVPASTVRYMMQPHYIMFLDEPDFGEAKWNEGIINEESDLFKAYVAQCQAYKDAGTRVIFNWGGAVDENAYTWWGIKNVPDNNLGTRSAPHDLEQYAVMFAKTLKLLRTKYGLTNVDTVNYHNEINMNNFAVFGDKRVIWVNWLKLAHEALVAEGIRDDIKIIGLDAANNDGFEGEWGADALLTDVWTKTAEWFKYIKTNALDKGYCDYLSTHIYNHFQRYTRTIDTSYHPTLKKDTGYYKMCEDIIKWYPDFWCTEYAGPAFDGNYSQDSQAADWSYGNSFECSRLGQFLAQANTGFVGSNQWGYFGGWIPSPLNNMQRWNTADKSTLYEVYWQCVAPADNEACGYDEVNAGFGEMGLLHRYVPKVNNTLGTTAQTLKVTSSSKDVRFAAFTQQTAGTGREDITFVVEANKGAEQNFEINVDAKYQNKKFNKFVFVYPTEQIKESEEAPAVETERFVGTNGNKMFDANAVLTPAVDQTVTNGKITGTTNGKHTMIVYTTMDEAQQVYFENVAEVQKDVKKGSSYTYGNIKTEGLDNIDYDIEFSISTGSEYASINPTTGELTINPDAPAGEWISVKVAAKGDGVKHEAYAIGLVKITA